MTTSLILGGSGKVGRRVDRVLKQRGRQTRPASRSGETRFDWHDDSTWAAALDGVSDVFIVGPGSASDWSPLLARFLRAAAAAGVRKTVLLSARGVEFLPDGAVGRAEDTLRRGPVPWTVLRPTHFAQNFTEAMFAPEHGTIAAPVGHGKEPFIDVEDVAQVAATILEDGSHDAEVLELSGPAAITFDDAAAVLAETSGRPMRFQDQSDDEHVARLRADGTPAGYVPWRMAMLRGIRSGADARLSDGVQQVLHRPATAFEDWARREVPQAPWVQGG